jgi:hypothetical protein
VEALEQLFDGTSPVSDRVNRCVHFMHTIPLRPEERR